MTTGNCIVTLNGVVQNTFNPTNLTDITYNLVTGDNEDEYAFNKLFMGCFSSNPVQRCCWCFPHKFCCNLCIRKAEMLADDDENEAVLKKGIEMTNDPKNYVKKYLYENKNKNLKKAVEAIEKQTYKVKSLTEMVPAITVQNYSNCSVLINIGQAPFKFAHPDCRTGIFCKKTFQSGKKDDQSGPWTEHCSKLCGVEYGDTFGLGFINRIIGLKKKCGFGKKAEIGRK